jgi:uncharacterized protein
MFFKSGSEGQRGAAATQSLEFDHMKFQPDRAEGVNLITRHEPGRVWVGTQAFEGAVVVPWKGTVQHWSVQTVKDLSAVHFERLLALKPELVLFGSGPSLVFPAPTLLRALIAAGVGVETMDTAAACRTYNVLATEHRSVVAALLPAR